MNRYDYSRCNGIEWSTNDGKYGFCVVCGKTLCLCLERPHGLTTWKEFDFVDEPIELDNFIRDYEFMLLPRNAETKRFHAGDVIVRNVDSSFWQILECVNVTTYIIAKFGIASVADISTCYAVSVSKLQSDFHYRPTSYEASLVTAEDLGNVLPLPLNTLCLWRDSKDEEWQIGTFESYGSTNDRPYVVDGKAVKFAIPYNDDTWHMILTDLPYSPESEGEED